MTNASQVTVSKYVTFNRLEANKDNYSTWAAIRISCSFDPGKALKNHIQESLGVIECEYTEEVKGSVPSFL